MRYEKKVVTAGWLVGWLVDVIYADPSLESDMQHTTTIYICLRTCRVFHFLKNELRASSRPAVA
jgi:hypothetical protein